MRQFLLLILTIILFAGCKHTSPHDKTLLTLADSLVENHPENSLQILKTISSPLRLSSSDYARYALLMSQALDKCGYNVKSDSLIKIASSYYPLVNDYTKSAYAFLYQARCVLNREDVSSRLENLSKSIKYATASNNYNLIGSVLTEKSEFFKEQQKFDSVIYYEQLAYKTFAKTKNTQNCILSLINIGDAYYKKEKFQEALLYYKMAEKKAMYIKKKNYPIKLHLLLSHTYYHLHQYDSALLYGRLSLKTKDIYDHERFLNVGTIFVKKGMTDSATYYLKQCLHYKNSLTDCYLLLQQAAEQQGNLKEALKYSPLIEAAKDSDYQRALSTSSAIMNKRYNSEKVRVENKKLLIHNQQYTIIAILSILLCFVVSTFVLIEKNRKKKLELQGEAAQNIIFQQQLQLQSEQIKKVDMLQRMIQLKLISQDNLAEIGSQYLKLFRGDNQPLPTTVEGIIEIIDNAFNNISEKIENRFPNLTLKELQICCCLRAGFDSGSILTIFDIKHETYYRYRSNIRKKMGVGAEDKIEQILCNL